MPCIIPVDTHNTGPDIIDAVVEVLLNGEMIIFPTETLYGLGVDCENEKAVQRLYNHKKRSEQKAVPVIASDLKMVLKYIKNPSKAGEQLIERFWPGPLTLVFEAQPSVLPVITGNSGTIGIRIPDSGFCRDLVRKLGRCISATSANFSGCNENRRIWDIPEKLRAACALILHGGETPRTVPSTVISLTGDRPVMLREGVIKKNIIEEALGNRID